MFSFLLVNQLLISMKATDKRRQGNISCDIPPPSLLSAGGCSAVLTRDTKFLPDFKMNLRVVWFKMVGKHWSWLVTNHLPPLNPESVQDTRSMQARQLWKRSSNKREKKPQLFFVLTWLSSLSVSRASCYDPIVGGLSQVVLKVLYPCIMRPYSCSCLTFILKIS